MSKSIAHDVGKKERSLDVLNVGDDSLIDFRGLHLSEDVVRGLLRCGFHKPSPIQLKAIPAGRAQWDLLIKAKSGTGKTCVFSALALEKTDISNQAIQVLILSPSREIAIQNKMVLKSIGHYKEGIEIRSFIGGILLYKDCAKLCRTQIAVGTPGRIVHLLREFSMDLSNVKLLVLDEADKLFERGLFEDIQYIIKCIPKDRQMIATSATYPDGLDDFICRYMEAPHKVFMTDEEEDFVAPIAIAHYAIDVRKLVHVKAHKSKKIASDVPRGLSPEMIYQHKLKSLREIINQFPFEQCIIFLSSQLRAQRLYEDLKCAELDVVLLSGSMYQKDRTDSFRMLREGKCKMMVATELAGRGIDAESVDLVINYDSATELSEYLHRIGRAGRFGAPGTAITFLSYSGEWQKMSEFQLKTGFTLSLIETMQELEQFASGEFAPNLSKIIGENEGDGISAEFREEFSKLTKLFSSAPIEALNKATLFETLATNAYPDVSAFTDHFDFAMEEVDKLIELRKLEVEQDAIRAQEEEHTRNCNEMLNSFATTSIKADEKSETGKIRKKRRKQNLNFKIESNPLSKLTEESEPLENYENLKCEEINEAEEITNMQKGQCATVGELDKTVKIPTLGQLAEIDEPSDFEDEMSQNIEEKKEIGVGDFIQKNDKSFSETKMLAEIETVTGTENLKFSSAANRYLNPGVRGRGVRGSGTGVPGKTTNNIS